MNRYSDDLVIYHHGILGQRWGVRRFQNKDGSLTLLGKKRQADSDTSNSDDSSTAKSKSSSSSEIKKESISDLSDAELNARINRINLEKRYKELTSPAEVKKQSRASKLINNILDKSIENVGTQLATYVIGKSVNKALKNVFGEEVVNPKKGQKDK